MDAAKRDPALARAIELLGGDAAAAKALGMANRQAIHQWKRCPPGRALALEAATNGRVKKEELRPDFYPPAQAA